MLEGDLQSFNSFTRNILVNNADGLKTCFMLFYTQSSGRTRHKDDEKTPMNIEFLREGVRFIFFAERPLDFFENEIYF